MATLSITTPDKFRVIYPWMPKKSIYSGDIKREGYWTPSGFTESDALVNDRNSEIFLPDVDGVYQEIDQDKLSRTNRGLYVNGQFVNLVARLNPTVAQCPTRQNVSDAAGFAGFGNSIHFPGGVTSHAYQSPTIASGVPFAASFLVQMDDGNAPVFANAAASNAANTFAIVINNSPYLIPPTAYSVKQVAAGIWRVSVVGTTPSAGTNFGVVQFATNQNRAFRVCGYQLFAGSFVPDALVPGSSDTGGPTLLTSDIRAVQGVRPSNSQAEPFAGWEAAGLDDGITILLDFEVRAWQGSTREVLRLATAQNSTLATLQIVSGSTTLRFTTVSGTDYFPGTQTGRIRAACRMMPDGTFALAREGQGSVVTGTKEPPVNLASAGLLTIGNRPGGDIPWNDWIYAVHICKPLSDQEMLDWVNGVIPAIPTLNNIPLSTNTKPIISGTCDFNTTKIYVYVDGIQAGTALGDEVDTWRCKLSLAPGTYQITARSESTIGKFSDYSDPITLVIADELSISGTPETYVQEGVEYSFTPTTTGGVPPYTYTLEDMDAMPDGMSIDPNTGELSGYPNPGIYEGIVIQVEDQE